MPQFDIASFFPQIPFFASIFILFYIFLTKSFLSSQSQNLKLGKKFLESFTKSFWKPQQVFKVDYTLLSLIYQPKSILGYHIYKETLCLISLKRTLTILKVSYLSILDWLTKEQTKTSQKRLGTINKLYINMVNETC